MGQEAERDQRRQVFAPYQVNGRLLDHAPRHALVMHCLPAHRGEEITSDVLDSDRSIAFQQAGNRLHAQKALLQWLLAPANGDRARKRALRTRGKSRTRPRASR
jgi:ornithine carbamoyltransferase